MSEGVRGARVAWEKRALATCSISIATFQSTFASGWLPMKSAEHVCSAQISSGKLNGVTTATPPKGMRMPVVVWPTWSPGIEKPRASVRTWSDA